MNRPASAWLALGVMLLFSMVIRLSAEAVVSALASCQLDLELKGLVLVEELNCVACHAGDASLAARSRKAPRLSAVGSRVNPGFLESFIRDPHGTKPGTMMPDVLSPLGVDQKERASARTACP